MKISTFYKNLQCEEYEKYGRLFTASSHKSVLSKAVRLFCTQLGNGASCSAVLCTLERFFQEEYKNMELLPASWAKELLARNDTALFKRFFSAFGSTQKVEKVFAAVHLNLEETLSDGSRALEGEVHLITSFNGAYHGYIFHPGPCKRSIDGESTSTAAYSDLSPMAAKLCLEQEFPGILIHVVYLQHKNDTLQKLHPYFEITDTASSNMHLLSFKSYYRKDGSLDRLRLFSAIKDVISKEKKKEKHCGRCEHAYLCRTQPLEKGGGAGYPASESSRRPYHVPSFTEEQLKVVRHLDGPMRVCAGPGSGKTATLIGRIQYLVEEKQISPAFLLVVTFTREAAEELKKRCLSFLPDNNLPKISTLNAFCFSILKENQDLLGMDLKVLTKEEQLRIVEDMVKCSKPLTGINYHDLRGGSRLYASIAALLGEYFKDEARFLFDHPQYGKDFVVFAEKYREIIKSQNYITFDQQISMCNWLFQQRPDVLAIYQDVYHYVMVDEYQDVNSEQVQMLSAICRKRRNILIVGDDDQSIYGFRGASADFMIGFDKLYPDARTVVLKENFRSTEELVAAGQQLIQGNVNRIRKDICSGSGKHGALPYVIPSFEPKAVDRLIESLHKEGYPLEDIAICSTRNAPLEELHEKLSAPTILAKSYLKNDGFFIFVRCALNLMENLHNDKAFFQYLCLFKKEKFLHPQKNKSFYESILSEYHYAPLTENSSAYAEDEILADELNLLADVFLLKNTSLKFFLDSCASMLSWKSSNSLEVLKEACAMQKIKSLPDFLNYCNGLVIYDSDIRVEASSKGKVMLITSHDSKGTEFPVVILRNDFTLDTEEQKRLFYVTMTRAKEKLFILQDTEAKVNFLQDIPHVTMCAGF